MREGRGVRPARAAEDTSRWSALPPGAENRSRIEGHATREVIVGRDDPDHYSDEDVALILHKATELAGLPDVETDAASSGLSLTEIKAIGAEVGIDPALIERAARLIDRQRPKPVVERLIGGPLRYRVDAHFPVTLTQESATHLLSAVRAEIGKRGQGEAHAAGTSWHSERGPTRVSVTAHSDDDGTTVRIGVDRTSIIVSFVTLALMAILAWAFVALEDIESLGDLLEWIILGTGGLAVARTVWASSTRAIERRTTALLDAVSGSLSDQEGQSGDE